MEQATETKGMIRRRVKVERGLAPQAALEATCHGLYAGPQAVASMPEGEGGEVDMFFFKLSLPARDDCISDDELAREYEIRGLKSDPRAQVAVNADDPEFADKYPNSTHWKDAQGNWCYLAFVRLRNYRHVYVYQRDNKWFGDRWFGGVCM